MAQHTQSRRTPTWVRWTVLAGILLLMTWGSWVVVRGLIARDQLTGALPTARSLATAVVDGDDAHTDALVEDLKHRAAVARDMTHDPIWRTTEMVPWIGPNLTAVRELTEVAETLTSEGLSPLVSAASEFDPSKFTVAAGAIDLSPIVALQGQVGKANDAMAKAAKQAAAIDRDATVGPVREAVDTLLGLVNEVTGSVDTLDRTAHLVPAMLGQDGPRNTLLLVQNNAELRASGGVSGALVLIRADAGRIEMVKQASTIDFNPPFDEPVLPLDEATHALFGDKPGQYIQDVNLLPWFDVSGELAKAMWESRMGDTVDAVVAVDPVLLSYLLDATGSVNVGEVTLSAENAVSLLLSETYVRFPDPRDQDQFFAAAAQAVFGAVTDGKVEARALVESLVRAGGEGRIRIWNARPEEQLYVEGTTLSGVLPSDNVGGSRLGVYFNDATGAKMDYYLGTEVKVASGMCRADGRPSFQVTVVLENTAPLDAAESLPEYVTGGGEYGVAPGRVATVVTVYGPVGSEPQGVTYGNSIEHAIAQMATDRGRPAVMVPTELGPGESVTLVYSFLGEKRERGALTVDVTPTLYVTETQHRSLNC